MTGQAFSEEVWTEFWEGNAEEDEVKEFTRDIVSNTLNNIKEIDEILKKAAENWSIERMAIIDRNILRAAAYELCYRTDIPCSVVINEALEIAKKYSTEESAPFINGLLDKIAHLDISKTASKKGPIRKGKQKLSPE